MSMHFTCPECGQLTKDGLTEMTYEVSGIKVVIKDVPAQICPDGHSYVNGYTGESVNRLVNRVVEDVNSYSRSLAPAIKRLSRQLTGTREVVITA
ncbi:MAG: hypothetical protein CVU38_16650 [Chloroflexi bacterium HGW-Chloroflexi-1]|nr:MAG: hypothetical protein CVU38_16650 [Chloroflexi bacterium HGW-Chloroflexi-1]